MITKSFVFLCFLLTFFSNNAQNYPGGVTGSEVWYIADWKDINIGEFKNSAQTNVLLDKCGEVETHLFNFNPSIFSDKLCLFYPTPLENSTGRNMFFVGEPFKQTYSYSHFGTLWNNDLVGSVAIDSIIRNFFDLNNKSIFSKDILESYSSDNNARVNFYHTNHYNINKKFKSYGQIGETEIYIGKLTVIDQQLSYGDQHFHGNFPEFISFPRELSANERNRVESYLALKYGLTLSEYDSYVNSRNIIFWNNDNNRLFSNRIFGFGIDQLSGLLQLQSESTHLKEHLIAAVGELAENNMKKQEENKIREDNHFLVFGDNGEEPTFGNENSKKVKLWKKIWLAQRTGKIVSEFPVYFKLFLPEQLKNYLSSNPEESLWLIQDKFVNNDEASDFDNENLEYYEANVNLNDGFANFKDIFFDTDLNVYDQFTFGVGPQMIVQAQVQGCKRDRLTVVIDITGGKPKYDIKVVSGAGNFEDYELGATYSFNVEPDVLYQVTVYDQQGLQTQLEFTPEPWDFSLDLGGIQYLSSNQPEIILNAGTGIGDPDAIYEWYFNGNLLSNNENTLSVSEQGDYSVTVTSADQSCSVSDNVTIDIKEFEIDLSISQLCGSEYSNTLFINIQGGIPPFITNILGQGGYSVNHAHSGNTNYTDMAYGTYHITTTDSVGNVFADSIEFLEAEEIILDLYSQLELICVPNNSGQQCVNYNYPNAPFFHGIPTDGSSFSVDASIGVTNQNVEYQWYVDGQSTDSSGPILTLAPGFYCYDGTGNNPMFTVVATDVVFDCVETQSFIAKRFCPEQSTSSQPINEVPNQDEEQNAWLKSIVYPNPTEANKTFIYEVFATENFSGTVELYTIGGARLYSVQTKNAKNHKLPFKINSAGVYLIKITTSLGDIKIDRIIIN
jgi:hypothetical protein